MTMKLLLLVAAGNVAGVKLEENWAERVIQTWNHLSEAAQKWTPRAGLQAAFQKAAQQWWTGPGVSVQTGVPPVTLDYFFLKAQQYLNSLRNSPPLSEAIQSEILHMESLVDIATDLENFEMSRMDDASLQKAANVISDLSGLPDHLGQDKQELLDVQVLGTSGTKTLRSYATPIQNGVKATYTPMSIILRVRQEAGGGEQSFKVNRQALQRLIEEEKYSPTPWKKQLIVARSIDVVLDEIGYKVTVDGVKIDWLYVQKLKLYEPSLSEIPQQQEFFLKYSLFGRTFSRSDLTNLIQILTRHGQPRASQPSSTESPSALETMLEVAWDLYLHNARFMKTGRLRAAADAILSIPVPAQESTRNNDVTWYKNNLQKTVVHGYEKPLKSFATYSMFRALAWKRTYTAKTLRVLLNGVYRSSINGDLYPDENKSIILRVHPEWRNTSFADLKNRIRNELDDGSQISRLSKLNPHPGWGEITLSVGGQNINDREESSRTIVVGDFMREKNASEVTARVETLLPPERRIA